MTSLKTTTDSAKTTKTSSDSKSTTIIRTSTTDPGY